MPAPSDTPALPWDEGLLDTGDGHRLHYAQYGNPQGVPAVSLHGGPGSGYSARHREFFDATRCRIVLFDQRGCGRSEPRGGLHDNTLAHLVADIERLRRHLGIGCWLVVGGSWGAALALAYAAAHPAACSGLVLRAAFLGEREDLRWFFQDAGRVQPEAWETFSAAAPPARRHDLLAWYAEAVGDPDFDVALTAVRHWMQWEAALAHPEVAAPPLPQPGPEDAARLIDKYRVQSHYLLHDAFLGDGRVLALAQRIAGIPVALLHGRLDLVCRPWNSWRLHRAIPGSRLRFVDGVGHDPFATPMLTAIRELTNRFATHGDLG